MAHYLKAWDCPTCGDRVTCESEPREAWRKLCDTCELRVTHHRLKLSPVRIEVGPKALPFVTATRDSGSKDTQATPTTAEGESINPIDSNSEDREPA